VLEGVLASVPHRKRAFHRDTTPSELRSFPFESKEYADPDLGGLFSKVEVPNAVWHQARTFITFIFPTYEEEHMRGIAEAIRKVIAAYAK
jgi:hypothetical protein